PPDQPPPPPRVSPEPRVSHEPRVTGRANRRWAWLTNPVAVRRAAAGPITGPITPTRWAVRFTSDRRNACPVMWNRPLAFRDLVRLDPREGVQAFKILEDPASRRSGLFARPLSHEHGYPGQRAGHTHGG